MPDHYDDKKPKSPAQRRLEKLAVLKPETTEDGMASGGLDPAMPKKGKK